DRQTAVSFGNIVNQLLNKNRFTYSCTAKQAGFTTFSIGTEQVNNLDSCLKHLSRSGQLFKIRRGPVDWILSISFRSLDPVNRFTDYVKYASLNVFSNRHRNRCTGIDDFGLANQTVG